MNLHVKFSESIYNLRTRLLVPDRNACYGMILMFHRVIEDVCEYSHPQIARLHVTVRHLENLLEQLRAQGYEIISLDDLHSTLNSGRKNFKFAVFTFDDAYRDTYELALPVFRKHSAPFTVYVPTAVPDQQIFWWYYMLDDLVFRNNVIEVPIAGENYRFALDTVQQKECAYSEITSIINGIDVQNRNETLKAMFELYSLDPHVYARKLSMTWDQIHDLNHSGLATIGGHTVNHNNLMQMSANEVLDEMERCKSRIEEEIGCKVDHFCYPFGAANYREFNLARKVGFKTSTTCQHGYLNKGHRSYLERLPRIMIEETTSAYSLAG
jgi:peptidoglycan/xylan/chitin deacetylase (PgdA/CDA1 family)